MQVRTRLSAEALSGRRVPAAGGLLAGATLLAASVIPTVSATAAIALPDECTQAGTTVTCTYTTGSNQFTVPDGVSVLHAVAVGGRGGSSASTPGGNGARVTADLNVSGGDVLYLEVGGNGEGTTGGANGGGDSSLGGRGGGGGSDIRDLDIITARMLVAGGGGGAGTPMGSTTAGGAGGDAETAGAKGDDVNLVGVGVATGGGGGGAGQATDGGSGGAGGTPGGEPGTAGSFGQGGDSPFPEGGGGGGGGLWGGGSGGQGGEVFNRAGSGGGGGGSNLVPPGGTATTASADAEPRIVLSYQTTPDATVTFTSDPAPDGVVGESYSHTFTATGDSGISYQVTSGSLPPGLTLSGAGLLSGTPTSEGTYPFTVTATGDGGASAAQGNTVTITADAPPPPPPPPPEDSADLSVHLSASPNPVKADRDLTYTVVVSNTGPDTAKSVRMSDVLPEATQFAAISPGPSWSCKTPPVGTSGTLICDAVALAAGTSSSISFTVKVVSSGKSTITNTAKVASEVSDPDDADNTASVTTSVRGRR